MIELCLVQNFTFMFVVVTYVTRPCSAIDGGPAIPRSQAGAAFQQANASLATIPRHAASERR